MRDGGGRGEGSDHRSFHRANGVGIPAGGAGRRGFTAEDVGAGRMLLNQNQTSSSAANSKRALRDSGFPSCSAIIPSSVYSTGASDPL